MDTLNYLQKELSSDRVGNAVRVKYKIKKVSVLTDFSNSEIILFLWLFAFGYDIILSRTDHFEDILVVEVIVTSLQLYLPGLFSLISEVFHDLNTHSPARRSLNSWPASTKLAFA